MDISTVLVLIWCWTRTKGGPQRKNLPQDLSADSKQLWDRGALVVKPIKQHLRDLSHLQPFGPSERMISNRSSSSIKICGDYYLYLLLFLDWRTCTKIAQRSGFFLKEEAQHILLSLSASSHYLATSSRVLSSKSRSTLSLSTTACRQTLLVVGQYL